MTLDGVADSPTRAFPRTDSAEDEIFSRETSSSSTSARYFATTPGITVEAPSNNHQQTSYEAAYYTDYRITHPDTNTVFNMPDHRTVYVNDRLPTVHCIQKSPSYGRIRRNTSASRLSASPANGHQGGVSRSQSLRTSRRPQSLDPCHRFRNRIASIPSDMTLPGDQQPVNGSANCSSRTSSNHSLPSDEADYTRLRNFCVTPKGLVNRGDSFRSKSRSTHSVVSNGSVQRPVPVCEPPAKLEVEPSQVLAPKGSVKKRAVPEQPAGATGITTPPAHSYKVLLLGGSEVGKTALMNQFTTSDYICSYDMSQDEENEKTVNLVLNQEESELVFVEVPTSEDVRVYMALGCGPNSGGSSTSVDAACVVYSVTNKKSFTQAKEILMQLERLPESDHRAVILVGNKTDLVRLRAVTVEEGRALATSQCCKFIETSVGINHQVDELLVGILTQIRLKQRAKTHGSTLQRRGTSFVAGCKAKGFIKRILKKACSRSRSCDNLHVL